MGRAVVPAAATQQQVATVVSDTTRLRSVSIVLTASCNLRCAYCYQNAKNGRAMEWATLQAALEAVLSSSERRVSVTFAGGEPLLQFDLIECAVRYVRARRRPDQAIDFYLLTNGLLLGARETRFLARAAFHVRISVDGAAPAQALRARDTFRALDDLLNRLRRDEPGWFRDRISVSSVATADSIQFFADSMAYLLSTHVRDIVVGPALTYQPAWQREGIDAFEDGMSRVLRLSIQHFRRTGEVPIGFFREAQSKRVVLEPPATFCGAGRSDYLTVDIDGQVSGCPMFAKSYQRFPDTALGRAIATLQAGQIDDPNLPTMLSNLRRRMRATGLFTRASKHSSYARCATCRYRRECSLCPVTMVHQPGTAGPNRVPDFPCAFQRVAGRFGRQFSAVLQ